jgi:hypothetical protein
LAGLIHGHAWLTVAARSASLTQRVALRDAGGTCGAGGWLVLLLAGEHALLARALDFLAALNPLRRRKATQLAVLTRAQRALLTLLRLLLTLQHARIGVRLCLLLDPLLLAQLLLLHALLLRLLALDALLLTLLLPGGAVD